MVTRSALTIGLPSRFFDLVKISDLKFDKISSEYRFTSSQNEFISYDG